MTRKLNYKRIKENVKESQREPLGELMDGILTTEQILEASSNGLIVTDKNGCIHFVNVQAENILGLDIKNIRGENISNIFPMAGKLVMKCLKSGNPRLGEHIVGKGVNLFVNVTPIWDDGQVRGTLYSFQRLEQLEDNAKKLESYKRLNKQLNAIFHSSSDGIWVCDSEGNFIAVNEASENLNGNKAEDVIGMNVVDLLNKGLFDRAVGLEVLDSKRRISIMQRVKKTGKDLLVTGTPVFSEAGDVILVVGNERDITQLNSLKEQLEQSRMVTEKFRDEITELGMMELKKQEIFAESDEMRQVIRIAFKLAKLGASHILVLGETGTGKGLVAKFIHKNSPRAKKPFIQINCAALPETLLEAELFGYEKGAFTGAKDEGKVGLFELAHGGTLFLDEIGDLPLSVQAKLLKYLDDNEILCLGGVTPKKVDCTVISATNRDLESLTKEGRFRDDLFYRLNTFTIRIPPLRERPEDIFELAHYFLQKYNKEYGQKRRISSDALHLLQLSSFPGNVRELKNILKRAVVMSENDLMDGFVFKSFERGREGLKRLDNDKGYLSGLNEKILIFEKEILKKAAKHCKSTREMASYLRVSQSTVIRRLRKHHLSQYLLHK